MLTRITLGAGLAAGLGVQARADIIYSGIRNEFVTVNDAPGDDLQSLAIDIDGSGLDVSLILQAYNNPQEGPDDREYGSGGTALVADYAFFSGGGDSGFRVLTDPIALEPEGLLTSVTPGAAVDLDGSADLSNFALLYSEQTGMTAVGIDGSEPIDQDLGHWELGESKYFAFQLPAATITPARNGWMQVRLDDTNNNGIVDRLTAIDWAYEDSGAPLAVGAVPEPASMVGLGLGALGLGARSQRKRRR